MRSFALSLALVIALSAGFASFGSATDPELHLALLKSEPGADSTVAAAPPTLRLFWTEPPKLAVTAVRLMSPTNQPITLGTAKANAADAKIIEVPVTGRLTAGVYSVTWRTAGDDGHVLDGTYKFTVRASD